MSKKRFFLPIFFFSIVAYSFTIYNRTVGVDDFSREGNIGRGNTQLAGRWGMVLWNKLVGTTVALDPFIDRFLSLLFLIIAAVLFCYVLYMVTRDEKVLPYTIVASIFVTYPLINSIWEYTIANYIVAGNLCLVTLATITLISRNMFRKKMLIASSLLLLPISSYESSIFYYISLVCIVVFLESCAEDETCMRFSGWIKKITLFAIPLVIAFFCRFAISFIINYIYNLQYVGGGATRIAWLQDNFFHVMKCLFAFNLIKYVLSGLVYFPITVFVLSVGLLYIYILSQRQKRGLLALLGMLLVFSLFSQSFLQGMELEYRHAQTITLFVAFSAYLLSVSVKNKKVRRCIYVFLFVLCWHQAVYMNRILGLNNLRSDNEVALIHQIGIRLSYEFGKKPVAFVGEYQKGPFINNQISVDESSWNGSLFYSIYNKFVAQLNPPYQYGVNVNTVIGYYQLRDCFKYFGYDIDVVIPSFLAKNDALFPEKYIKTGDEILNRAIALVTEKRIKPYEIYDAGDYLVVCLGK